MNSREPRYFKSLYDQNADPWEFETSPYERQKYESTIAILGDRHFNNAIEVGCSIGVLTARLAAFCDRLLAVDIVEIALESARSRCRNSPQVKFEIRQMPMDWPGSHEIFDLILLSEVLYFLSRNDIIVMAQKATASLEPGGWAILVNFTEVIDEPCSGDEAAEIFIGASKLNIIIHARHEKYRIDVLTNDVVARVVA